MKQAYCTVCGVQIAPSTANKTDGQCIPCSRIAPSGYRRSVPVTVAPEAWSEASKRSTIYGFPPQVYEDEFYQCLACNARSVFTALEQREAFEKRKAYIWQRRTLCNSCWLARRSLEREVQDCTAKWNSDRAALQQNRVFLQRWLQVLRELPAYGRRRNNAIIRMLESRLNGI